MCYTHACSISHETLNYYTRQNACMSASENAVHSQLSVIKGPVIEPQPNLTLHDMLLVPQDKQFIKKGTCR